jgi:hypothetical protein
VDCSIDFWRLHTRQPGSLADPGIPASVHSTKLQWRPLSGSNLPPTVQRVNLTNPVLGLSRAVSRCSLDHSLFTLSSNDKLQDIMNIKTGINCVTHLKTFSKNVFGQHETTTTIESTYAIFGLRWNLWKVHSIKTGYLKAYIGSCYRKRSESHYLFINLPPTVYKPSNWERLLIFYSILGSILVFFYLGGCGVRRLIGGYWMRHVRNVFFISFF